MSTASLPDRLTAVIEPAVAHLGLELEAVELAKAGRRRLLRVIVDVDARDEDEDRARGVTLDRLAEATRAVSRALDDAEAMSDDPYTLEVTSPGVDRPLTAPRHWRRNIGRLVKVSTTDGGSHTGRVLAAGDVSVTLEVSGTALEMRYDDIASGAVQVEFNRKDG